MQNNNFLTEVSPDVQINEIDEIVETTETAVTYFTNICDKLVTTYTKSLDELMSDLQEDCIQNDASDEVIEKYILEISNMLYFIGNKMETMGIKDDLSKLAAKEVFNEAYLDAPVDSKGKKPTVAEITANAENASKYETVMNNIYSRAYRLIKFKVDAAYEMLASLRKILSKRMQDAQLSMQRNNGSLVMGSEEFK